MSTHLSSSHSRSVNKQFSALSLAHGFYARQVASNYHFPITLALGGGHCIGIISLGGGYHQSDIDSYFGHIGYAVPQITHVLVNGQPHTPTHDRVNAELTLDIQIAGAIAPEANIVIYHAPNNEEGFIAALPVVPSVPKDQLELPIKIVLPNAFTFQPLYSCNTCCYKTAYLYQFL